MSEERKSHTELWVAAVVTLAVMAGLYFKGFTGETLTDAVKDIGDVAIPILCAFLAAHIVTSKMDQDEPIEKAGEDALGLLQKKYPEILAGPKGSRENYDPDKPGNAGRYLFFQGKEKQKAQFIPVLPLKEGILEIRAPKTAFRISGLIDLDAAQQSALPKMRQAVEACLKEAWKDKYEVLEHKHPDIAIVVDFEENDLGPKRFGKAVYACGEAAVNAFESAVKSLRV